jgi:hypothetical protein
VVAMQELQSLLKKRKTASEIDFNPLNHHIHCYTHIINICSSHIVASMTPTSKLYLSDLKVPSNHMSFDNNNNNNNNNNSNNNDNNDGLDDRLDSNSDSDYDFDSNADYSINWS